MNLLCLCAPVSEFSINLQHEQATKELYNARDFNGQGSINYKQYNFGETYCATPPPLKAVIILTCITTARLCSTYACVLNWPFCAPGLLPSNIIDNIFNYM